MDIRKKAVSPTGRLHLRDADDRLMYVETEQPGPDGVVMVQDKTKPIVANLYGPGSKEYVAATTWQNNQFLSKLKRKGKGDQTPAERQEENAEFLARCTRSFENMEYGDLKSEDCQTPEQRKELALAIYSDETIGFIADGVAGHLREWSNFLKQ